ncbi:MAG: hypothetical protein V4515_07875 [Chloroflexota bacterium]
MTIPAPRLTRAEALAQARRDFSQYAERVAVSGLATADYVLDLGRYWDRRLASLGRLGADLPVAAEVLNSLAMMARELRIEDLDPDAALRWLDAFPDGVADLFPPSDVTFRLLDEEDDEASVSGRRAAIASAA